MKPFEGVITALITPFKDGRVDLPSFRRLLQHQLASGVKTFVINGTTAESPTLDWTEVRDLFQTARKECGSEVRLIVGTGTNSTSESIRRSQDAEAWGADGLLTVVPYYNKPPQRGLIVHFRAIAETTKLPVILYNVPSRTITAIEPQTLQELAGVQSIIGIKEATGDMELFEKMKSLVPQFNWLSGDDMTCMDFCLRGGHGVISVCSHILGGEMNELLPRAKKGEAEAMTEYKERYSDVIKALYLESNPIPVKAALQMMGVIDSAEMRAPLVELASEPREELKQCLMAIGKIPSA